MPALGKIGLSEPLHFFSSTTITVPAGVHKARVIVFGAGGAGGGVKNDSLGAASGGAGGGYAEGMINVVPGETATITVGTGGVSSSLQGTGSAGGTSSFLVASKTISATGGGGGTTSITNGVATVAPTPGVGTNGDINSSGGISGVAMAISSCWTATGGASPGNQYGNGYASGASSVGTNATGG